MEVRVGIRDDFPAGACHCVTKWIPSYAIVPLFEVGYEFDRVVAKPGSNKIVLDGKDRVRRNAFM